MELNLRSSCRGQVTRVVNASVEYLSGAEVSQGGEAVLEDLSVFLARLKTAHDSLKAANDTARLFVPADQVERDCEQIVEYEDKAIATIARLELRIKRLRKQLDAQSSLTWANSTTNPAHHMGDVEPQPNGDHGAPTNGIIEQPSHTIERSSISAATNLVRLPKIELKKFTGELREWFPFWEQFRSAVHNRVDLDDITKFHYLQTVLTGRAATTIRGLTPTAACYKNAINLILEEYGNAEKITSTYIRQLMNLPPVHRRDDAVGLRKLYNSVLTITRSLSAMNVPSEQYNLVLKANLLKSLPNTLRIEFYRTESATASASTTMEEQENEAAAANSTQVTDEQIDQLMGFVKREVQALEKSLENEQHVEPIRKSKNVQRTSTAAGLLAASASNKCLFCNDADHETKSCNTSMDLKKKREILMKAGCCFRCTKPNHSAKFCKSWVKCVICGGKHAAVVCDPQFRESRNTKLRQGEAASMDKLKDVVSLLSRSNKHRNQVLLQTAWARSAASSGKTVALRLVLDGGSQVSFIRQSVSQQLGLRKIGTQPISIVPFGCNQRPEAKLCNRVQLKLISQYTNDYIIIELVEVPEICIDILEQYSDSIPATSEMKLADVLVCSELTVEGISILIGADYYWTVVNGEIKRLTDSLVAMNSVFGWVIHGKTNMDNSSAIYETISTFLAIASDGSEDLDIRKFWDLEMLGIIESPTNNNLSIKNLITFSEGRYEAKLPWRNPMRHLADNRMVALVRMKNLVRSLSKDYRKLSAYDQAINDLIRNGYAEIVPPDEHVNGRIYYMPHKPVYREDKSTSKLRVVFDASSHAPGECSLNECLDSGENLNPELLAILLSFRMGKIAATADIEKAFLRIALAKYERNSHRFLWIDLRTYEVIELRMASVTFGVTSSPYILSATLSTHLRKLKDQYPETCARLMACRYVDDFAVAVDEVSDALNFYKESVAIMKQASMNLRKWTSNNEELRKVFNESEGNAIDINPCQRILGLNWYISSDELSIDIKQVLESSKLLHPTKRNILQTVARIYDPLGLLGPFTVRLKILLQEIWLHNLDWDDNLPMEIYKIWYSCYSDLEELSNNAFPRWALSNTKDKIKNLQLHLFSDASPRAYGAVAFIRETNENGEVSTSILCAKNRVAPLKEKRTNSITLPKLELTGALIATRLKCYLIETLKLTFNSIHMWADSKIALHWIKGNPKRWQQYVKHRVEEIQNLSTDTDWRFCPGKDNPADLLTRGISAASLIQSNLWAFGPLWLRNDMCDWPSENDDESTLDVEAAHSMLVTPLPEPRMPLLNCDNFSKLRRLLHVTAYVFRFINALKSKRPSFPYLTAEEICYAENYWIKSSQLQDVQRLQEYQYFEDDNGTLRLIGRMQQAPYSLGEKHPIILLKTWHITKLIILDTHERTFHGGLSVVLAELRKRFWVIRARQATKSLIRSCIVCKKLNGKPAAESMAPLPKDRIIATRPFENVGVDFAGPLYIRSGESDDRMKVYIMLISCAVTRALHLELCPDLTANACLQALRRFVARRSRPSIIYSDNAKNFKRVSVELEAVTKISKVLLSTEVQNYIADHQIKWKFIPERAPWWGGFYERMVRIVKSALKLTIGRSTLNYEQMRTLLTEVEAVVNSRPLTYITNDDSEPEPLTPFHFLTGVSGSTIADFDKCPGYTKSQFLQLWKTREAAVEIFWQRWKSEYFQQLRTVHHTTILKSSEIERGSVVLVHDPALPRLHWKMGIVEELYPGRDGKIRCCQVRMPGKNLLRRPIQLLYPLELDVNPGPEDVEIN